MKMDEYKEKVEDIKSRIEECINIISNTEFDDGTEVLSELYDEIEEDSFELVVVGEFSRGKSTLVNALLGKEVLPMASNPTTAILNVINDGEEEEYILHYHDGKERNITRQEFLGVKAVEYSEDGAEFVKANTELHHIQYADIRIKNKLGENGITIIDTPGVNDLNERREQITYEYIPKADAAIMVCSAKEPLSASEMKFLKNRILGNSISKVFLVVNHKDLMRTADDEARMKQRFVDGCKGLIPESRIFLVSSKQALTYERYQLGEKVNERFLPQTLEETNFPAMEKALSDYLANERGDIKIERYNSKLNAIISEISTTIERQIKLANRDISELQNNIDLLLPKIEKSREKCDREIELARRKLLSYRRTVESRYRNALEEIRKSAEKAVKNYEGNSPEELHELISDSIDENKRFIQFDMPEQIKADTAELIREAMTMISEEVSELELDFFTGQTKENNNFAMTEIDSESLVSQMEMEMAQATQDAATKNELSTAATSALLGAGIALVMGAPVLLPVLFVGAKFLMGGYATQAPAQSTETPQNEEKPALTNAMVKKVYAMEVKRNYGDTIQAKVEAYGNEYEKSISDTIDVVKKKSDKVLNEFVAQIQSEVSEKESDIYDVNERRRFLESINDQLWKKA